MVERSKVFKCCLVAEEVLLLLTKQALELFHENHWCTKHNLMIYCRVASTLLISVSVEDEMKT